MSVLAESWTVVARRAAVEEKLEGGAAAWCRVAPNDTACMDRNLCAVGFMHVVDAEAFLRELEQAGFRGEEGGQYRDVAVFTFKGPWRHSCSWVTSGTYATHTALWLSTAEPEPLVVSMFRRPGAEFINMSAEEAEDRLEFVRREGNVEVYRDKSSGEEFCRGRTTTDQELPENAQRIFETTVETINPMLCWNGRPKKLGFFAKRKLKKGIRELETLTAAHTEVWRVWWFLGMAHRAVSAPLEAYEAFRQAYHANPEHPDVMREYSGQCVALGKGVEAVAISERNCSLNPDDGGLWSNLALALMIADNMDRAREEITKARTMDPDDTVTKALELMIDEVIAGDRERLTKFP